jgi:hypothetical protein
VRSWIQRRDPAFFRKIPFTELPYPEPEYLSRLLVEPHIQRALPALVRPPPAFQGPAADPAHFASYRTIESGPGPTPLGLAAWQMRGDGPATFSSVAFEVDRNLVSVFVAARADSPVDLWLLDSAGQRVNRLDSGPLASDGWKRVNFAVAEGRYRLVLEKRGAGSVIFTQPQTDTRLARTVDSWLRSGRTLWWAGIALGVATLIAAHVLPRRLLLLQPK